MSATMEKEIFDRKMNRDGENLIGFKKIHNFFDCPAHVSLHTFQNINKLRTSVDKMLLNEFESMKEDAVIKPTGLRNPGQICFMNSVLQALVPIESFSLYLKIILNKEQERKKGNSNANNFVSDLQCMLEKIKGKSNVLGDASMLLRKVGEKHSQFSKNINVQQDAQEFFEAMMDMIDDNIQQVYFSSQIPFSLRITNEFSSFQNPYRPSKLSSPVSTEKASQKKLHVHRKSSKLKDEFPEEKKQHEYEEDPQEVAYIPRTMKSFSSNTKKKLSKSLEILLSSSNSSDVPPLYSGWIGSYLQCAQCQHIKPIQNTPFFDIPIIPIYSSLEDCIDEFFSTDCLTDVECRNCTILAKVQEIQSDLDVLNNAIKSLRKRRRDIDPGIVIEKNDAEGKLEIFQSFDPDDDDQDDELLIDENQFALESSSFELKPYLKTSAKRALFLSRLPPVLIFHIQRKCYHANSNIPNKLNAHVRFPLELDVSPWLFMSNQKVQDNVLYQLRSVVEHLGKSGNFGHYQTFYRLSQDWVCVSDESVQSVTWEYVQNNVQAYMLFYEAI